MTLFSNLLIKFTNFRQGFGNIGLKLIKMGLLCAFRWDGALQSIAG